MTAQMWGFKTIGVLIAVLISSGWVGVANAQNATVSAQTSVSATVPDNGPPTTPILIAPGNNTYVTITQPSFVWEESTDIGGMDHYRLTVDGATLYDNIPLVDTDNSSYTLTYNSGTGRYSLYPKTAFSQGSHTWKIGAYDTAGQLTESATWTFTIDTQAPTFVMTQMGSETVSISAQDLSTIPSQPVELDANEPLLSGTGEANASVQLIVTIPGDPSQNHSATISSGGTWSIQLGILPRDVVITLDFVITDVAGNISVLSGVQFTIPSEVIVFPPPSATPSPTATASASVSPSPGASAAPGSSPEPPTPASSPLISIPVIPPREVINEVLQEIQETLQTPFSILTSPVFSPVVKTIQQGFTDVAPYSAAVVAAALPTVATIALASQFGGAISPDILIKVFQALGLIPAGKPQGLFFDSETEQPVPFALLTFANIADPTVNAQTVVSDDQGIYRGVRLPPGKYRLTVTQQDYTFPTKKPRPPYLSFRDFYKGEEFSVSSHDGEQLFLIPMDPVNQGLRKEWRNRLRLLLARVGRLTEALLLPMFIISGVLAILFPSIWNWAVWAIYCVLFLRKVMGWFRTPVVTGTVINQAGEPLEHVTIRMNELARNELTELEVTDKKGRFNLYGPRARYQLSATKPGYVWYEQNGTMSLYEVDCTTANQQLIITMTEASLLASSEV